MKALFRAVVCSIFAAFLFLVIPITAEAMENTPAFIISGDIININGNDTIKTYGGHTYWLTKEQMETIVSGRDTTPIFNKNFWSNGSLFSSYEKHGSPTWRYHKADGIYLNDLLMAIGVNDKDIANLNSVRFHASDKYITQMDYYGLLKRYYYSNKTIKANEGKEVYPMLAFYQYSQTETSEGVAESETKAVPGGLEPTLVFGQTETNDQNNCSYAKYIKYINLGGAEALVVTVNGGPKDLTYYYTVADLILMGAEKRSYTINNRNYTCYGVDLSILLDNLKIKGDYEIRFTVSANGNDRKSNKTINSSDLKAGDYMITYYSEKETGGVENDTEVMLYSDGIAMGDLKALTLTPSETKESKPFTDLSGYYWAEDAINNLYQQNAISGTGKGTYSPANNIKRGDFILMLYRAFGLTAKTNDNFADVKEGSYYYKAIAVCKALGIAKGDGTGFNPESSLTRQDAIALVYRTLEISGKNIPPGGNLGNYNDGSLVSDYAKDAVKALTTANIIQGSNGSLNPKGHLSRAEMAIIINKVINCL